MENVQNCDGRADSLTVNYEPTVVICRNTVHSLKELATTQAKRRWKINFLNMR
jgi:hypothetical protein